MFHSKPQLQDSWENHLHQSSDPSQIIQNQFSSILTGDPLTTTVLSQLITNIIIHLLQLFFSPKKCKRFSRRSKLWHNLPKNGAWRTPILSSKEFKNRKMARIQIQKTCWHDDNWSFQKSARLRIQKLGILWQKIWKKEKECNKISKKVQDFQVSKSQDFHWMFSHKGDSTFFEKEKN